MTKPRHPPGTFCWADLATTDTEGAKAFYTALFDWQASDDAMPGGGTYTMFTHQDGYVAATYNLTDEMKQMGVPVNWLPYVSVEDARATAASAVELGGTVAKEAFEIGEDGVMAVIQDPSGGVFGIWQAKASRGTDYLDSRPHTVCWNELASRDAEAAGAFYTALLGWTPQPMEMGGTPYTMFMSGEARAAGMLQMTEEWGDIPSHWMMYVAVEDCDAAAARVSELGGQVCVPPTDIPVGRFAVVNDPQGGTFSIVALAAGSDS